ncbi:regulator [Leptotrichia sp. oral taxon 212]|nr:regulator [Leptotrichia sp. oral taxon 212]
MGKNKLIILKNLERICKALDCIPNDVFSFDDEYIERKID